MDLKFDILYIFSLKSESKHLQDKINIGIINSIKTKIKNIFKTNLISFILYDNFYKILFRNKLIVFYNLHKQHGNNIFKLVLKHLLIIFFCWTHIEL